MIDNLTYGSVCSGIEAATAAWHVLGWRPTWFAEIEDFPSRVLAHHYPDVPNLGDMTQIAAAVRAGAVPAPDVLVGGTPCQAFSVAGLRESLDDARGQLTLAYVELADAIDDTRTAAGEPECIIVWENVPGVLNTKDNAFGCFLGALAGEDCALEPPGGKWANAGCVSGPKRTIAWRVLDAQYFGVAQRRRRVFVVAGARAGFDPTEVLFEFDGVRRDSAPSREAGQEIARTVTAGASNGGTAHGARSGSAKEGLIVAVGGFQRPGVTCMAHGQGGAEIAFERSPTLTCNHEAPIAFDSRQDPISSNEVFGALGSSSGGGGDKPHALVGMAVRRLTPRECERLQGFPDDYTLIPMRGKPAADGPRYKALGNSMAVPCMRWIGQRIAQHLSNPYGDLL